MMNTALISCNNKLLRYNYNMTIGRCRQRSCNGRCNNTFGIRKTVSERELLVLFNESFLPERWKQME